MTRWPDAIAALVVSLCLLSACESSGAPTVASPGDLASPSITTSLQTPAASKHPAGPNYTVFSSCLLSTRVRRPDFQALTCGDAGLQLIGIHYDSYKDFEATGRANVYTRPVASPPDAQHLARLRFPVTFRAFRVRSWKGWRYFTRLRLDFLNGQPPRVAELYSMPMLGPLAPHRPLARTGPFLASGGHLCWASKLRATANFDGGAGGWNIGGFEIRNESRQYCALRGPVVFRGLDDTGTTVTSISVCQRKDNRHTACDAPIVLGPFNVDHLRQFPREVSIQMYGWSRGGKRDAGCPVNRQVRPATFQVTVGDVVLHAPNPSGRLSMWGCDDVTIAVRG